MKKFIFKTLNVIRWIIISFLTLIASISLAVMFQLMIEEGGAPGYDPKTIFTFYMTVAAVSLPLIFILALWEPIAAFIRRKYLWWRFKIVT
ncbi:MAG: hypothetical protein WC523_06470 [Patescibacteria group bacterium]|jgi:hypothetical protein